MTDPSSIGPPARRRWGQNFLAQPAVAERLVEAFDPSPDDVVVEIGPGRGALTRLLAPRVARLVALEVDPKLVELLTHAGSIAEGVEVRNEDALRTDWDALFSELGGSVRVIGNLPYNIGTALVRRLLRSRGMRDLQAVLQLEVVQRFCAVPRTRSYGPLAVVSQLRGEVREILTLSPALFRPRPKVRSAALRVRPFDDPPLPHDRVEALERWLFLGFGHRRKTLAGNLGPHGELARAFLVRRGLSPSARAEELPPATWLELAQRLEESERGPSAGGAAIPGAADDRR